MSLKWQEDKGELKPFSLWDMRQLYSDAKLPFGRVSGFLYLFFSFLVFIMAIYLMAKNWYSTTWYMLVIDFAVAIIVSFIVFRDQNPKDRAVISRCGRTIFALSAVLELAGFLWARVELGEYWGAMLVLLILAIAYTSYFLGLVFATGTSMVRLRRNGGAGVDFTYDETENSPSEASLHGVKKKTKKKGKKKK